MTTMTHDSSLPARRLDDADVRVLLLENIHADGRDFLRGKGYQVETRDGALGEDELIEAIQGVHLLGIRSTTYITQKVLDNAPDLLAIGAFCIGTNQIDLPAASRAGIAVFNAPYSNTRSVVELAIAEIISLARRLHEKSTDMHRGVWNKSAAGSHEVRGRTLGIIGYGNIGSQLSVIAEALGLKVIFFDIDDKLALGNAKRCSTIEELLGEADVVSLHVDGRPGNAGFFGAEQFDAMKPRSLFLNLSRGIAVDTESLRGHLESGHIAGAALDVFPVEPKRQGDPFSSELQGIPNELYESAKMDGAGALRRLRHITIPMLRPTTLFLLVMGIIGSLQVFTQIFVMTSGGPVNKTTTMVYYMYLWAFKYYDMGYASTLAFALFAMLLVFTAFQLRLFKNGATS
ncbi:MAG: phosphoglycerate dehydrogenase [Hyphomicrobiales bacterium]|nr:MAG: phosphoglycerate dehydrogenase [Hyphomicrobiales bacterium]